MHERLKLDINKERNEPDNNQPIQNSGVGHREDGYEERNKKHSTKADERWQPEEREQLFVQIKHEGRPENEQGQQKRVHPRNQSSLQQLLHARSCGKQFVYIRHWSATVFGTKEGVGRSWIRQRS